MSLIPTITPIKEVRTKFIFPGEIGIWQTLRAMRDFALGASAFSEFNAFAKKIAQGNKRPIDIINALTQFTFARMRYAHDPDEFEYVKDPVLVMREIQTQGYSLGDCDDHVTFLSALWSSFGIPNSMIAVELESQPDEGFCHVVNGIPEGGGAFSVVDTSVKSGILDYKIISSLRVDVIR